MEEVSNDKISNISSPITGIGDNILVLARLLPSTGNFNTAYRIRKHYEDSKFYCTVRDPDSFNSLEDFQAFVLKKAITGVIGLHALRSGKLLLDCPVPFAIIFGGTDINENSKDKELLEVMTEIVSQSCKLVICSASIEKRTLVLWPKSKHKFLEIYPGVTVHPSSRPSLKISKRFSLLEPNPRFLTLVAGIRPVKDPLFLVQSFTEWHQLQARDIYLVIMGPVIDREYSNRFYEVIDGCPGVLYVGALAMPDAHAIMKQSFAVINTSTSEGICTAIIEAMKMEVPVVARHIPDNVAIIDNGITGLLFRSPDEFIAHIKQLEENPEMRKELTMNAKKYALEKFSTEHERSSYLSLAQSLCDEHRNNLRLLEERRQQLKREQEEQRQLKLAEQAEAKRLELERLEKENTVTAPPEKKDKQAKKK